MRSNATLVTNEPATAQSPIGRTARSEKGSLNANPPSSPCHTPVPDANTATSTCLIRSQGWRSPSRPQGRAPRLDSSLDVGRIWRQSRHCATGTGRGKWLEIPDAALLLDRAWRRDDGPEGVRAPRPGAPLGCGCGVPWPSDAITPAPAGGCDTRSMATPQSQLLRSYAHARLYTTLEG